MKLLKDEYDCDYLEIDSEDDLYVLNETLEKLRKRALPVARALLDMEGIKPTYGIDEDDIKFEDSSLYAEYEMGCRGYYETETITIPFRYLFDDDWLAEAELNIRQRKEREAEKKRLQEIKRKKAAEDAEYKKYLKLKEKFD